MKRLALALMFCLAGCITFPTDPQSAVPEPEPAFLTADRDAAPVLVNLLDERKLESPVGAEFSSTILKDIVRLTTPTGYRLKNRYLKLGVPLAQALYFAKDAQLQNRLLEAARWTSSPRARSEALVVLAKQRNPEHLKYFREALLDSNVAIQFAAIEALQVWAGEGASELLLSVANQNWSPVIRVYAAQAALRLGSSAGRDKLLEFLRERNWLMRAMAARYLGDMGRPEDGDLLLSRIGPEQDNKFVLAEVCIAALKLTGRRLPASMAPPPPPSPRAPLKPTRQPFELEPLVVTAPRLKLMQHVDVRIDNDLVRLLEKMASEPIEVEKVVDPDVAQLSRIETPVGFSLAVRYNDLIFLLIEGLAGSRDLGLVRRLEEIARNNSNANVRAAALVALGYDRDRTDLAIFQAALRDATNTSVRFAAVEALGQIGGSQVIGTLADVANSDRSRAVQIFAAQALRRSGDPYGREILLRALDDADPYARAMATYYLGEVGEPDDYNRVLFRMNNESNNFAVAEACLALYRLSP
ncbi:MAG TPA: HEAT repeat domain-containing protein [Elusimicrobiota bacterium]|nr:HEAT repeat domain-containing protein [Elusimicrobiota bacterium]